MSTTSDAVTIQQTEPPLDMQALVAFVRGYARKAPPQKATILDLTMASILSQLQALQILLTSQD